MGSGKGMTDNVSLFSVVLINVLSGLLGALLFALAVWMRMENEVRQWVYELGMYQYWNGLYILMAAGIIIMLISFCGCCGALTDSSCLLGTNFSLHALSFVLLLFGASILLARCIAPTMDQNQLAEDFEKIFRMKNSISDGFLIFLVYRSAILIIVAIILELAGGIYVLVNGVETAKLSPWLTKTFNKLIIDSNYNPRANLALQAVQEKVGCCGSTNYMDYDKARLPISDYCRDAVTGNVYQDGCVKKFSGFIEKRSGWLAGIALFIVALQVILVILSIIRCRAVRDSDEGGVRRKQQYSPVATRG